MRSFCVVSIKSGQIIHKVAAAKLRALSFANGRKCERHVCEKSGIGESLDSFIFLPQRVLKGCGYHGEGGEQRGKEEG